MIIVPSDILSQLEEKANSDFEQMHPEACGLFFRTAHIKVVLHAVDALVCFKMNLNSGGKVPVMRATKFVNASNA
jgi:hypothetical protein